jgi:hypothetical protein
MVGRKIKQEFDVNVPKSLELLGVDGMSSDESDHAAGQGEATYFVLNKVWRSPKVTEWLRVLDALHLRDRYAGEFHASSGAWPHFRTPSDQSSQRPSVCDLPVNFYSPFWLSHRTPFQRKQLRTTGEVGLILPRAIKRLVGCRLASTIAHRPCSMAEKYDLSNRKTVRGQGVDLN